MDLADYMKEANLTDAALAERVGRDRTNVARWRTKRTRPDFDALVMIEEMSDGRVTARDFVVSAAAPEAAE